MISEAAKFDQTVVRHTVLGNFFCAIKITFCAIKITLPLRTHL